jgi:hypothetical protein
MDCAPNVNIFRELQSVHDTGYFSGQVSPEEDWQQVRDAKSSIYKICVTYSHDGTHLHFLRHESMQKNAILAI